MGLQTLTHKDYPGYKIELETITGKDGAHFTVRVYNTDGRLLLEIIDGVITFDADHHSRPGADLTAGQGASDSHVHSR